jgi:predicted DNA binding CopG/RHH family protein
MKVFNWNLEKNAKLKKERNISFEEIVVAIHENQLLDVFEHPNQQKYPNEDEELEIKEKFEANLLKKSESEKDDLMFAKEAAQNTFAKSKKINIKLSEKDLKMLKIKALESGVSYQTIIGMLIHQFAEGRIKLEL